MNVYFVKLVIMHNNSTDELKLIYMPLLECGKAITNLSKRCKAVERSIE